MITSTKLQYPLKADFWIALFLFDFFLLSPLARDRSFILSITSSLSDNLLKQVLLLSIDIASLNQANHLLSTTRSNEHMGCNLDQKQIISYLSSVSSSYPISSMCSRARASPAAETIPTSSFSRRARRIPTVPNPSSMDAPLGSTLNSNVQALIAFSRTLTEPTTHVANKNRVTHARLGKTGQGHHWSAKTLHFSAHQTWANDPSVPSPHSDLSCSILWTVIATFSSAMKHPTANASIAVQLASAFVPLAAFSRYSRDASQILSIGANSCYDNHDSA